MRKLFLFFILSSLSALSAEDGGTHGKWKCKIVDSQLISISLPEISSYLSTLPTDPEDIPLWESALWLRSFSNEDSIEIESGHLEDQNELITFELQESGSGNLDGESFLAFEEGYQSYRLTGEEFESEEDGTIERTRLTCQLDNGRPVFHIMHQSVDTDRGTMDLYLIKIKVIKSIK